MDILHIETKLPAQLYSSLTKKVNAPKRNKSQMFLKFYIPKFGEKNQSNVKFEKKNNKRTGNIQVLRGSLRKRRNYCERRQILNSKL